MKVSVWGCRGSLPSPGPEKNKYGGNTSCVQVAHGDTCIILDGGSGIQRLGTQMGGAYRELHIMLTHLHIDHTMGLGFFLPLYNPDITVHMWGPAGSGLSLLERLRKYFSPPLFPVRLNELPLHPVIHEMHNNTIQLGDLTVQSAYICHPSATLGYRISTEHSVFTYMPDHEVALGSSNFPNEPDWTSGYDLAARADLLFHDAQYRPMEYRNRMGWGHSSVTDAFAFAKMCQVKKLSLFHHDPLHTDEQLEALLANSLEGKTFDFDIELCAEGNYYELP
jgi:phosphoribosyl 1,2-cyclic phosphodiesterase